MMRVLILTLLLMSSCKRPFIGIVERCTSSFHFDKCICYDYNLMTVKRISKERKMPIEYCDDITGFHARDWKTRITPWGKKNIRAYNNSSD